MYVNNNLSKAVYCSDLLETSESARFVQWNGSTLNTPFKAGITDCQEGFAFCYGNRNSYMTVIAFAKNSNKMWAWSKASGNWVEYATKSDLWPQNPGTKITENTDMYTITTPGHYYCGENATAASLKNCPCTEAFTLTVYRGAGGPIDGMYTIQEYTSYTGNIRITQTYNMDSKNWTVHKFAFSS